jgi:oxygen-independent coproporphyrinogen-3 oxidase
MSNAACIVEIKSAPEFDLDLIRTMNQLGPRYTSYPTADRFTDSFQISDYKNAIESLQQHASPLSIYIHIPFCASICYYCACNKVITKDRSKADIYLDYLKREINMQAALFSGTKKVEQLHFGGGTPTYINDAQMSDLLDLLHQQFEFAPDETGEYSIEVDPRTVTPERIGVLREQGFNRLSLGIQDFNPEVQKAVNRIQPEVETLAVMLAARLAGFRSVSVDLIYGLPKQTLASIDQTLDQVIRADPDRIAIYNYAHMPHLFKPQRRIDTDALPDPDTKLQMLSLCIQKLTGAGYIYIGMDHFAKPDDDLCKAQRQRRLQRNFQGYSTHAHTEMLSCGVSAISAVGTCYTQNEKTLEAYYARLDRGELPIARGFNLNREDEMRRDIIGQLMCHFELDYAQLNARYGIKFIVHFRGELLKLGALAGFGMLTLNDEGLKVSLKGRLLIRNICMVFDAYLGQKQEQARYSKTI